MAIPEPMKIGIANAIAAAGMLENASALPPSVPAHRHVMTSCALLDAPSKKIAGSAAQRLPSRKALPTARRTVRSETGDWPEATLDFRPWSAANPMISEAQPSANDLSGDFQSAATRTTALKAFASIIHGRYRRMTLTCSARIRPAAASSSTGPPKIVRSPEKTLYKFGRTRLATAVPRVPGEFIRQALLER